VRNAVIVDWVPAPLGLSYVIVNMHSYINMYICIFICIYIYICIYVYTYTGTYIVNNQEQTGQVVRNAVIVDWVPAPLGLSYGMVDQFDFETAQVRAPQPRDGQLLTASLTLLKHGRPVRFRDCTGSNPAIMKSLTTHSRTYSRERLNHSR